MDYGNLYLRLSWHCSWGDSLQEKPLALDETRWHSSSKCCPMQLLGSATAAAAGIAALSTVIAASSTVIAAEMTRG